ncbi:PREDICTED: retinol-binding protein 5 isoform X1 [Propithecus coquereli]|uniref:retinol-binding protein 5 isoform X1 n=1 Tax=Propithecus coquereli TaxID=379532 RepID=UPI00063F580B|nr:PREDICTED: retinol-binding protein 5 isoform X1 [Propithecus coquereli]
MPPNLTGYYRFVSQKNIEDYLQALDINVALRKIALLLKPDKEITHQGDHMIVKTLSTFRNYVLEFEVGVEFEEDLRIVDGRKCQVTADNSGPLSGRLEWGVESCGIRAALSLRTQGRSRQYLLWSVRGSPARTIVTWEEEQLVCVQKGEVPNRGWRHWLEDEKLYLELTARDAVCEQVFRKVR